MSKLALLLFMIISANSAQTQERTVDPQAFSPKSTISKNRIKASTLFNEALDEFGKGNFDNAYSKFIKVSEEPSASQQEKGVSLFNAALSLERMKRYDRAIDRYTIISADENIKGLAKDSYYRISACCHYKKDWACVIGSIENWKNYGDPLSLSEEFEYRVRKGHALFLLKLYKDSIEYTGSATKVLNSKRSFIYVDARKRGFEDGKINQLALLGLEALAGSYKATGDSIKISYTEEEEGKINMESLSRLLELKAYYYLRSQDAYIDMLNYGDKDSATKGLFLLGELYSDIYNNLLKSEVPPDIKNLKLEKAYTDKLKESLRPIMEKARTTYKKNLELSERYKFTNEWIDKSKKALNSL